MISEEEIAKFSKHAVKWLSAINFTCEQYQLTSKLRKAHFLAQIAHESGDFRYLAENLNYSANGLWKVFRRHFSSYNEAAHYARQPKKIANRVYANRMGNGDEASGDGWRYRGKGAIQITGKNNTIACLGDLGIDDPELLTQDPYYILSAGWFWNRNNLNKYADEDNCYAVSGIINRGSPNKTAIGLDDRENWLEKAKNALND